jgi:arsenite methyltransferase
MTGADSPNLHASSQGHALAEVGWQDAHFEGKRRENEAMLRSIGLAQGWHVLDAGCGSGSYLPLIAEAVGPTGQLTAFDLAPETIAAVAARLAARPLDCPVATRVGDLLTLPFPDAHLDAVWCANTTQYLSDEELMRALHEFRRVVRPGGIVAIKDADVTRANFAPGDPTRLWRLFAAARETNVQIRGTLRAPELRRWLEQAGLVDVWQRTTLIERWAPLRAVEREYLGVFFGWYAQLAAKASVPQEDLAYWRQMRDTEDADHPLNREDFQYYDGQVVAVGRVPAR